MSQLERQMRHRDREMVPKILVQAMFALMVGSLVLVAYAQWANVPNSGVLIEAPIVESREITLQGDRTGNYLVLDSDGEVIAASTDEKAGFIAVIGRVLARERLVLGVATEGHVQVVRRQNGNVAVVDPNTAMSIELIGYGADNVAAFANLLN